MDKSDDRTDSVNTRFVYTNDIVAAISILGFNAVFIYATVADVNISVSIVTAYILVNLAAAGWLFGKDLISAFRSN